MPPKGKAPAIIRSTNKATTDRGGDAGTVQPKQDAAARSAVAARGVRLQKLDGDGAPVGEPVSIGDGTAALSFEPDDSGIDLPESSVGATVEMTVTDPEQLATLRETFRIPIPTAVVQEWFPAYFRPPGESVPWIRTRVFLTPQGLYVYTSPPEQPETFKTGAAPAWYSTVDFAKTSKPVTGYAAMNAGVPIMTAAGKAIVQPTGGCKCNTRSLRNWTPTWSRNRISWTDAVALAATPEGS